MSKIEKEINSFADFDKTVNLSNENKIIDKEIDIKNEEVNTEETSINETKEEIKEVVENEEIELDEEIKIIENQVTDIKKNDIIEEKKIEEEYTLDKTNIDINGDLGTKTIEDLILDLSQGEYSDTTKYAARDAIINFQNVGLRYKNDVVLDDVSLEIERGDFIYLVGESGAGKSSMIKMLYKEIDNTSGSIIVDSQNITKLKQTKYPMLRRKIGVIFQDYKLLKDKTVFENVAYTLEVTKYPKKKIKEKVNQTLEKVGIIEHANKFPDELSGGQQQRAAIARAVVDSPKIVVADEPTGNLDPENAISIMQLLEKINSEGTTVVMATHDVGIVNNFPKRVVLLGKRKILKETKGQYIYEK